MHRVVEAFGLHVKQVAKFSISSMGGWQRGLQIPVHDPSVDRC